MLAINESKQRRDRARPWLRATVLLALAVGVLLVWYGFGVQEPSAVLPSTIMTFGIPASVALICCATICWRLMHGMSTTAHTMKRYMLLFIGVSIVASVALVAVPRYIDALL